MGQLSVFPHVKVRKRKKSKFFTGFAKKTHILTTNMDIFTS